MNKSFLSIEHTFKNVENGELLNIAVERTVPPENGVSECEHVTAIGHKMAKAITLSGTWVYFMSQWVNCE